MLSKRVLLPVTIFILLFVLAACSSAESEAPAEASESIDVMDVEHTENADAEHAVHWSYEGEGSPEHWADIDGTIDYETCGLGTAQSPIDLTTDMMTDLENIAFSYNDSAVNILNNGHTVQVNYDEGSSVEIDGHVYNLLQFHFHAPSEHAVNDTLYPAEMHLVHGDAYGHLAVVGVFITEGAENPAFTPVWDNLPAEETKAIATGMMINATDLLPAEQIIYRYNGSLTTPPCSEGVLWSVMQTPVEMSADQIGMFTDIFEGNNRPLQELNGRDVQLDSTP